MEEKTNKILYLIQLPPPVHGVTIMNEMVYKSDIINHGIKKELLEIKFSNSISSLQKLTLSKIIAAIILLIKLCWKLICLKPNFIYFTLTPTGLGFIRDFFYVLLIKLFGSKIIFHIHNKGISEKLKFTFFKHIYKFTFSNSYIIQLSQNILKKETGNLSLKNSKSFIVENGIKTMPSKKIIRNREEINILFLSNLIPEKGIFILLHAFHQISKEFNHTYLTIIGETWNKKTTKRVWAFVEKNKLKNRINIKGPIIGGKKYSQFENADIFILPTFFDSFPLVILEAMQAGLPIISTFEGAIPEIIENNKEGILIQKKNVAKLIEKIRLLIKNKELRNKLGENAKNKFSENYTHKIFEKKMRNVFEEIFSYPI